VAGVKKGKREKGKGRRENGKLKRILFGDTIVWAALKLQSSLGKWQKKMAAKGKAGEYKEGIEQMVILNYTLN